MNRNRVGTAILLSLCLVSPPSAAATAQGATSIEALWSELSSVSTPDDSARLLALIHPDDRPLLAFTMFFAATMAPMAYLDDAAKAKKVSEDWDALVKRHRLDQVENAPPGDVTPEVIATNARKVFAKVDLAAFTRDTLRFVQAHTGELELPIPRGTLKDIKVNGATATALLDGEPLRFDRVDGRWFLRIE